MKPDYGFDDLMVTAAFRYCLGRQTYIVRECAEWLIRIWPTLSERAKIIIQRELEQAFYDAGVGRGYLPLGADCDRKEWEKVRGLWANHPPLQPEPTTAA